MTLAEHESGRNDAIRALNENQVDRLLVDARQIDAKMSVLDDFEFTNEHQSTSLASVRIAVVHRADESKRFKFIEDVSANRGGSMKTFTDEREAIDWLTAK